MTIITLKYPMIVLKAVNQKQIFNYLYQNKADYQSKLITSTQIY
ncbi:hypothetical protein PPBDW_I20683 [Photobacterium kishitanii]|nr:hypothetical protein PPBDW_I20683 [Photobacterium kishitanii]